jgi:hypothetical protein
MKGADGGSLVPEEWIQEEHEKNLKKKQRKPMQPLRKNF